MCPPRETIPEAYRTRFDSQGEPEVGFGWLLVKEPTKVGFG